MKQQFYQFFTVLVFALLVGNTLFAQSGLPYQAVARSSNGAPIINQPINVKFFVRDSIATGTVVYSEQHNLTTNILGLFSATIGAGTTLSGNFANINWGGNAKFMQIDIDTTGTNTNYLTMSTQQLLSVPYALYAFKSGSSTGGTTPTGISQTKVVGDSLKITLTDGQVQNAGYVRGPKGDSGARGLQGIQGIQGVKGDQGIQGATGPKGDSGAKGLQGIQGIQGIKGDQGIQGIQGATGPKGDSGARGLQGIQGIQGIKGDQGIQGIQGATGPKGDSGARGLQGIQGIQGIKGDQGIQGIQGATGPKGDSGARGLQGIQGIKGDQGVQGIQGATGAAGKDGVSITNSKVTGDSLFVTLSNGQVLNTGNVRGPKGFLSTIGNKKGGMLYWTGTQWDTISVGASGQYLQMNSSSVPTWTNPAPIARFSYKGINQAPDTVTFVNSSTNASSYLWDFGDSTNSTTASPTHIYKVGGIYTVRLTAYSTGDSSVITTTIFIASVIPTASFNVSGSGSVAPVNIGFTNTSTNGSTYFWDFGDNTTSTSKNPSHAYYNGGFYLVKLVVTNLSGSSTTYKLVNVGDAYTSATITQVVISNYPLTDGGSTWDPFNGPDFFINLTDSANVIKYNGSGARISDITTSMLPVGWYLSPAYTVNGINNFYSSIDIDLWDFDTLDPHDYAGSVRFKISNYITLPNPYPSSITLTQNGITATVYLSWK